jgi:hypothetical protein
MGSGAVIYVPSSIKIGSGIQKLIGGTHRQQRDLISLLYFFKIRKVGYKCSLCLTVFDNSTSGRETQTEAVRSIGYIKTALPYYKHSTENLQIIS